MPGGFFFPFGCNSGCIILYLLTGGSSMKTLIVDGDWNLKRNHHRTTALDVYGHRCNGTYGFLISLYSAINKLLPDRVVVCWDGIKSGKFRYEIYKPYKANRKKDWEIEEYAIIEEGLKDPESKEKYEILMQKIRAQNIVDDLFVRQLQADYIEADDLIAQYCLRSEELETEEEIIIFSRDKDYYQLISEYVSISNPDSIGLITKDNFRRKMGYTLENELMFKCFEGDSSDNISGVKGIKRETLIKLFPEIADKKFTYQELVNQCKEHKKFKKLKTLHKIVEAEEVLYRNAKLMNLKKPFISPKAIQSVEETLIGRLDNDRSIKRASLNMSKQGFLKMMEAENISVNNFLAPFYRLMSREKEYRN